MYEQKQGICVMCGSAYAEENSPTCHHCYVETMLAEQELHQQAADHHYREAED